MIYRMEMTVILDPVEDYEIIEQYKKDAGWLHREGGTTAEIFQIINQFNATSVYLASNKGGKA